MAFFISTVKRTEREVVLELPPEASGIEELAPEDWSRPADIARWLKHHSENPIVLISAYSGAELLEEINRTNPFGHQVYPSETSRAAPLTEFEGNGQNVDQDLHAANAQLEREVRLRTSELNTLRRQFAIESDICARAQDALRKSNQQSSLASSILHDVNNLLLVIYFSTKHALSQLAEGDPNRSSLVAIQHARTQATELTRRLRTVLAEVPREAPSVDLNHLIVHSEQIFRRLIRGNVIMTVSLSSAPAAVNAAPEAIERMILNLILNALSAIPEGGWVTIETGHDDVANTDSPKDNELPPGRYVKLTVSDTGCGPTTKNRLHHLDEQFEMTGLPETAESALIAVDQIVTRYGGRIDTTTSVENGTKVEIRLPAAIEALEPDALATRDAELLSGTETILVVEDEAYIRKYITITLETHGYRVLEADDAHAARAIQQRQTEPIDMLLVDSILPGLSGRKVAETFWRTHPDLPVVFMSGLMKDEVISGLPSNANTAFLQKPFATDELLMVIRNTFDSRIKTS
ncbi:response regulator [Schlesneria paludicola]|uniref:response regulator n=1 Tax=Schlesneria paludicola TaxID=360056 RepID=UPI00029B0BD6|nr:response regulator [Schlesneria paludicola]